MIKIEKLPDNPMGALTLRPNYLKESRGGWMLAGKVHEDYYEWINGFAAIKDDWGNDDIVCGNFETEVWATSQEAYDDFIKNFPPEVWNYGDI